MDFDIGSRTMIVMLVVLVSGILLVTGTGPRVVTAVSIASIAAAALAFLGIHLSRHFSPSSKPTVEAAETRRETASE